MYEIIFPVLKYLVRFSYFSERTLVQFEFKLQRSSNTCRYKIRQHIKMHIMHSIKIKTENYYQYITVILNFNTAVVAM